MIEIQPAIEDVSRLLGRQKTDDTAAYRLSKYCLRVPEEEGTLYYHSLTGALWLLEGDESAEACREDLIAGWALVPDRFDEKKQVDDLRRVVRMLSAKKNRTHFTVLTTTDCNARCFYCYEMGAERYPMSEQTARDTADYIAGVCGGEKVKLTWFGGEPLYNRRAIEIITETLRERGIPFSSAMVSNGYYLDRETAGTAVRDWNLEWVQISLDGTGEVYKRAKAYIENDADPLARVLDNIASALEAGIEVYIRLNMNKKNAADLRDLADLLAERFPEKKGLHVYAYALQEFAGPVQGFAPEDGENESILALNRRLADSGLLHIPALPRKLRVNHCMADEEAGEAIMPDGRIITCEHFNIADTIGHISKPERDAAVIRAWKETVCFPACEDCALYPGCISLKKCPYDLKGCHADKRELKRKALEASVSAAYRAWKEDRERM